MHKLSSTIWHSRLFVSMLVASLSLAVLGIVFVAIHLYAVPGPLILHFTERNGIDRVGTFWDVMEVALLGLIIVVINSAIAIELEIRRLFWGRFLMFGTLVLVALIFIGLLAIISVN